MSPKEITQTINTLVKGNQPLCLALFLKELQTLPLLLVNAVGLYRYSRKIQKDRLSSSNKFSYLLYRA